MGSLDLNSSGSIGSESGQVPAAAAWLGGLGVIPFLGLAFATPFAGDMLRYDLEFALFTYGAVILSFLGGIRWGLAINPSRADAGGLWRSLGLSVTPSLIAWAALLLPRQLGWLLLAVSFVAMLLVDVMASRAGQAPVWYPRLRWPLTCAAVAALLVGLVA
jgi:hypothetical protein